MDDTGSDMNPFDGFLRPIPKGFLGSLTELLEVRAIDPAWNSEDQGAEHVEEGGLSFAYGEVG